jgi:DNA primase
MFSCFACKVAGGLDYFVSEVLGITVPKAAEWLKERKYTDGRQVSSKPSGLRRYEEKKELPKLESLPYHKLAPYRSGKAIHKYLLDRGFSRKICEEFMIGWDDDRLRVTIPIFNTNNELQGFLARAVLEQKIDGKRNPEYEKIYGDRDKYLVDNFKRSLTFFPLNKLEIKDETIILVEGSLSALWMYQHEFNNVLAVLTSSLSKAQAELLLKMPVKKIVAMLDNDEAGMLGRAKIYDLLKNDLTVYDVVYPDGKNDPAELSKVQIKEMLDNMILYGKKDRRRFM